MDHRVFCVMMVGGWYWYGMVWYGMMFSLFLLSQTNKNKNKQTNKQK
jgi:hypothetical protein